MFVSLGFAEVAQHKHKQCWLYRQGDINFVVNAEPHSQAEQFASLHGPSVCGMAFRVSDAGKAQQYAIGKGAKPFVGKIGPMELNIPAIYGIGESTPSLSSIATATRAPSMTWTSSSIPTGRPGWLRWMPGCTRLTT